MTSIITFSKNIQRIDFQPDEIQNSNIRRTDIQHNYTWYDDIQSNVERMVQMFGRRFV